MKKIIRIPLIVVLIFSLVLVKAFETELFYDPLINFFQNDYLYSSIPKFDFVKLLWSLFLRYTLNSLISIGIIYLVFQKLDCVILVSKLYVGGFSILVLVYSFLLYNGFEGGYLFPFYIRRFLIHPLFLLLLLAALFYEKMVDVEPVL
ncbi:exosortase F system-associated protein [Flavicella sp.]|uniref:exosortase F system-associated membrane protein n=1 Tax=Flavicella sp. TaxID=2957742 RepID=UPI00301B26F0